MFKKNADLVSILLSSLAVCLFRVNVVLTRNADFSADGSDVKICKSLAESQEKACSLAQFPIQLSIHKFQNSKFTKFNSSFRISLDMKMLALAFLFRKVVLMSIPAVSLEVVTSL